LNRPIYPKVVKLPRKIIVSSTGVLPTRDASGRSKQELINVTALPARDRQSRAALVVPTHTNSFLDRKS
jgi:hypothetical protein